MEAATCGEACAVHVCAPTTSLGESLVALRARKGEASNFGMWRSGKCHEAMSLLDDFCSQVREGICDFISDDWKLQGVCLKVRD